MCNNNSISVLFVQYVFRVKNEEGVEEEKNKEEKN
jgi:hypothetical protein